MKTDRVEAEGDHPGRENAEIVLDLRKLAELFSNKSIYRQAADAIERLEARLAVAKAFAGAD